MNEKELEALKEDVRKEVLEASWKTNQLDWFVEDELELVKTYETVEKVKRNLQVLSNFKSENYPHHILGGSTWKELFSGRFLIENYKAKENIEKFYKNEYKNYLEKTENLESRAPVWLIGSYPKLETGEVLPIVIDYNEKKLIVLYINK